MSLNGLARLAPPPPRLSDDPGYLMSELPDWIRRLLGLPLNGRITPDRPGASLQGPPKTKPPFSPPGQGRPPIGHGPFRCKYCGRYGQPGACAGCGAPNAPSGDAVAIPPRRPDTILRCHDVEGEGRLDVTEFGEQKRRYIDAWPVPEFPMVKR
jgi:hypothetical protein